MNSVTDSSLVYLEIHSLDNSQLKHNATRERFLAPSDKGNFFLPWLSRREEESFSAK